MTQKADRKSAILFRIAGMKKSSHFEKDPGELALNESDVKSPQIEITVNLSVDVGEGNILIKLAINFKTPQGIPFIGIESESKFHIKNPGKTLVKNDCDELVFPQDLLEYFIGISLSGTRGMLAVLNTQPLYNGIILPPVDVKKIIGKRDKTRKNIHQKK